MRHRMKERLWGALRKWGPPVVLFGGLSAGDVGAQNVSVRDYSVPVSRADNLRIDALSFDHQSVGDSVVSQTGNLVVVYKKFYESLPFAYSIDFRGSASFRKDQVDDALKGDAAANMRSRVKKYKNNEGNLFVFGDGDLNLNEDFDRPGLNVTLGFGWGRFINATALRKAVRIEDFLLEEGIISERLQKETMIEFGHIIEKESEYRELYGSRYQNYWYEDMQNEVQKSGKVLGSIGAIGVLRMQEVLEIERINERFYGWDVSAGVQVEVQTPFEKQPDPANPDSLIDVKRAPPAFSLGVRYSRPISWSTQFNTDIDVNTPFTRSFGRRYDIATRSDFIYEISNRINYTLVHLFNLTKRSNEAARHDNTISTGLTFFIENKVNLSIALVIRKNEMDPVRLNFTTGLSYRIF